MKKVLSIAGSDCSGGAGIQADLKTILAHKLYGMSVITSLTAQNTMGVSEILDVSPEFVCKQMDAVFTDIFPDAVKIGMVSNCDIIEAIADRLVQYKAKNIVVDPVMISTSGTKLLTENAICVLKIKLLMIADLITPNIPEAEALCGFSIRSQEDMEKAAEKIGEFSKGAVLIKGGHRMKNADDLLYDHQTFTWFCGDKIKNSNTHGTGCTLSSAIACNLAMGYDCKTSIANAKEYLTGALKDGLDIGKGSGPLNHGYWLEIKK